MEPSHKTPKLKDWYVKPIEMITNNWAFILDEDDSEIIFVRDDGEVFDTMKFENIISRNQKNNESQIHHLCACTVPSTPPPPIPF